jgi:hypothetical protein
LVSSRYERSLVIVGLVHDAAGFVLRGDSCGSRARNLQQADAGD